MLKSFLTKLIDESGNTDERYAKIIQQLYSSGNATTLKTYASHQKHFLQWLKNNHRYPAASRLMVNQEKLLVYLHEEIVGSTDKRSG